MYLTRLQWLLLYAVVIGITINGSFSPVLNSNDAYFYAVISKTMATTHDWVNLIYNSQAWLDKPHLPFWLTALSFRVFGITTVSYVLPGLLFHFIGAYYTYRLGCWWYNRQIGLTASLIYLTSLHLMLSALDVRAEAYLVGEISAAVYYWLNYQHSSSRRDLVWGSFFTGLALMTKGLFVLIIIFSGLIAVGLWQKKYWQWLAPRWLIAYGLIAIFTSPELICLYLQFDAHPQQLVFGHQHISGLAWFFWGSQFGRFFNVGPIINTHGNWFFFIHTWLWAFLPWSMVFIFSCITACRNWHSLTKVEQGKLIYLHASFWSGFILFSATRFQLDHYLNILVPFAAVLCAAWLATRLSSWFIGVQQYLAVLLVIVISLITSISLDSQLLLYWYTLPLVVLIVMLVTARGQTSAWLVLGWSSLAIVSVFSLLIHLNSLIFPRFDGGYQIADTTNKLAPTLPVYSLTVPYIFNSLTLHSQALVAEVGSLKAIPVSHYWLVVEPSRRWHLPAAAKLVAQYQFLAQDKFIPSLFSSRQLNKNLRVVNLYQVWD